MPHLAQFGMSGGREHQIGPGDPLRPGHPRYGPPVGEIYHVLRGEGGHVVWSFVRLHQRMGIHHVHRQWSGNPANPDGDILSGTRERGTFDRHAQHHPAHGRMSSTARLTPRANSSRLNFSSTARRFSAAIRARAYRPACESRSLRTSASRAGSPKGTKRVFTPSFKISPIAPAVVVTSGSPAAIASRTATGNPSDADGRQNTSASAKACRFAGPVRIPGASTFAGLALTALHPASRSWTCNTLRSRRRCSPRRTRRAPGISLATVGMAASKSTAPLARDTWPTKRTFLAGRDRCGN